MLTYDLNEKGDDSLYFYLYKCIKNDIERGNIAPGARLPSKRNLASNLNVGLITVEAAYQQLNAEGYIRSIERRGYFVNDVFGDRIVAGTQAPSTLKKKHASNSEGELKRTNNQRDGLIDFDLTGSGILQKSFPMATWAKCVRDTLSQENESTLTCEVESTGAPELREQIARHLFETRRLEVNPNNIVIGSGAQTLYNLLIQLIGRDRLVALEDPGYSRLTNIYEKNNLKVAYANMDENGVIVQQVRESDANLLHIMPSHQFPTGIVTSIARRYELLGWANEGENRFIIEDDYDCEFRLEGRPIPTLQGIDASSKVIYSNTFTKSLGAAFRIAYLVLPCNLALKWKRDLSFYSCTVPALDQLALARFMKRGDFERHISRTKNQARQIRDAFLTQLKDKLDEKEYSVHGIDAGLHFIINFPNSNEDLLKQEFMKQKIRIYPLSKYKHSKKLQRNEGSFVIQYLSLDEEKAMRCARAFAKAVHKAS